MRIATAADMPALEQVAVATLKLAYPDEEIQQTTLPGFREQRTRTTTIIYCMDDLSAFILTERMGDGSWCVKKLMPPPPVMTVQMSVELIKAAFVREHLLRPFLTPATTMMWTQTEERSAVERLTRDAMQQSFKATRTDIVRNGVIIASRLSMTAAALARKLQVTL